MDMILREILDDLQGSEIGELIEVGRFHVLSEDTPEEIAEQAWECLYSEGHLERDAQRWNIVLAATIFGEVRELKVQKDHGDIYVVEIHRQGSKRLIEVVVKRLIPTEQVRQAV